MLVHVTVIELWIYIQQIKYNKIKEVNLSV